MLKCLNAYMERAPSDSEARAKIPLVVANEEGKAQTYSRISLYSMRN